MESTFKKNKKKEPDTVKALTPSGDIHLYFKYSDELSNIKTNSHSFGGEYDIDIRNNGGCIFVAPTSFRSGNTNEMISYKWTKSLIDNEPIDFPQWMKILLLKQIAIVKKSTMKIVGRDNKLVSIKKSVEKDIKYAISNGCYSNDSNCNNNCTDDDDNNNGEPMPSKNSITKKNSNSIHKSC